MRSRLPSRPAIMTTTAQLTAHHVAIIGGGPAGLMAAEVLAQGGVHVELFDAMPRWGASSCWPASAA